jgi:hypothetical protein
MILNFRANGVSCGATVLIDTTDSFTGMEATHHNQGNDLDLVTKTLGHLMDTLDREAEREGYLQLARSFARWCSLKRLSFTVRGAGFGKTGLAVEAISHFTSRERTEDVEDLNSTNFYLHDNIYNLLEDYQEKWTSVNRLQLARPHQVYDDEGLWNLPQLDISPEESEAQTYFRQLLGSIFPRSLEPAQLLQQEREGSSRRACGQWLGSIRRQHRTSFANLRDALEYWSAQSQSSIHHVHLSEEDVDYLIRAYLMDLGVHGFQKDVLEEVTTKLARASKQRCWLIFRRMFCRRFGDNRKFRRLLLNSAGQTFLLIAGSVRMSLQVFRSITGQEHGGLRLCSITPSP